MKTLVLAEKPSVGRELARVLGCRTGGDGCLIGDRYIVTWALGHLVTLADPEKYGDQYKVWSLDTLPMLPEKMELTVIPQTSKQYNSVKKLLHSPEVSELVIATDAGREGELVARWIIDKAGFNKPIKRLWISSQTDRAIKEGFAKLADGREYVNLYKSAVCRAEADWLVGLNVTRALTCKFNAQLSAGRVQTPTLAIIMAREEEIKRFRPVDYFNVRASLGDISAIYRGANGESKINTLEEAEKIAGEVKNGGFIAKEVSSTEKRTPPPALYDLTELQRDANKLYGYSPKQTLNFMQSLYERYKALTYPRTDSRCITDDIVPTLGERLRAVSIGDFAPLVKECKNINRSCVNNAKVTDHHAIIPTEERADVISMSNDEKRIYLMVVKRFIANFLPDFVYRQSKLTFECKGCIFTAQGREIVSDGWKKVYGSGYSSEDEEETQDEQRLPPVKKGDKLVCKNASVKTLKTTPPPRYTEATLLTAMENPSKFISDSKMKEYIGGGLGTPATRADIIEKLFSAFYLEKQGSTIVPTAKAAQLISLVPADLKEPLLTATWEKRLEAVKNGKADPKAFITEIRTYASELVREVASSEEKYVHENMTREKCPECGKNLLKVNGKHGTMLVCPDRECGFRKSLLIKTNVRCPNCHKTMQIFGEGDKKTYACSCGYRERVDRFHESRRSDGASKAEVARFLGTQNKTEPQGESAFAIAMKKAMEAEENKKK